MSIRVVGRAPNWAALCPTVRPANTPARHLRKCQHPVLGLKTPRRLVIREAMLPESTQTLFEETCAARSDHGGGGRNDAAEPLTSIPITMGFRQSTMPANFPVVSAPSAALGDPVPAQRYGSGAPTGCQGPPNFSFPMLRLASNNSQSQGLSEAPDFER